MLSVCRQLQMVILRRQCRDLAGRAYVAGLTVLDTAPDVLALE